MNTPDEISGPAGPPPRDSLEPQEGPLPTAPLSDDDARAAEQFAALVQDDAQPRKQSRRTGASLSSDRPATTGAGRFVGPAFDASRDDRTPRDVTERPRDDRSSDDHRKQEERTPDPATNAAASRSPGDAILRAFGQANAGETIQTVARQIADRVLVSDPALTGGAQEVRIMIKDSVLPGTEVRITRQGGELRVALTTVSPDSYALLNEHRNALQDRLTSRLTDYQVRVEVSYNDRNGDQQGRSRQQRNLYEEMEE